MTTKGPYVLTGHYYSVCLCPGEEVFERNDAFSLCDLYDHAPAQEPLPRGHEI